MQTSSGQQVIGVGSRQGHALLATTRGLSLVERHVRGNHEMNSGGKLVMNIALWKACPHHVF